MSEPAPRFSEESLGQGSDSFEACTIRQPDSTPSRYRFLGPDGTYDPGRIPDLSTDRLREFYRWMVVQQVVDERMVKLQRRGEMGTYASGWGHEASLVGFASAIAGDDWLFPYGREAVAMLIKGMPLRDLLLYWRGVMDANRLSEWNLLPPAIAIGTHVPVGVGTAWGMKRDRADSVTAMLMGEGHPSTGEVQAGMNLAGALDVPALFYVQNNQWTISCPFEKQTGAKSVAQKAVAWGFDGIRVDGMDVLAVYDAVQRARERALSGTPVLVESVTYRLDAHTTNDDPSRYRTADEVEWWERREPVSRFREYLKAEGVWNSIDEEGLRAEANDLFDRAREEADAYDPGGIEEVFDHVYEDTPPEVARQRDEFMEFLERRPDAMEYVDERPKG